MLKSEVALLLLLLHCADLRTARGDSPRPETELAVFLAPFDLNETAAQGSAILLMCPVSSSDPSGIDWMFDDAPLPASPRWQLASDKQSLRISNFSHDDVGTFVCTTPGTKGSENLSVVLTLSPAAPAFVISPSNQTVARGESATFRCSASGNPKPTMRWASADAAPIDDSEKYTLRPGALVVNNVTDSDAAEELYCVVENVHGRSEVAFRLSLLEATTPATNATQAGRADKDLTTVVKEAIERARRRVNRAIERTLRKLRDGRVRKSPSDILTLFRLPREAAIELTRSRETYEAAYREVVEHVRAGRLRGWTGNQTLFPNFQQDPQLLALVAQLAGCQTHARDHAECRSRICFHLRYRSFDGMCNNFNNPWLGASNIPLKRLLAPEYENGMNDPIGWQLNRTYGGFPKPSARLVSQRLLSAKQPQADTALSGMAMQWGQFLDHDLTFTPVDPADSTFIGGRRCNDTCVNEAPCFPIPVTDDDTRIRHRPCIGFVRSSATCGSGTSSLFVGSRPYFREQLNQITSFIDASNVYGSTETDARDVRELDADRGFLKEGMPTRIPNRRLLPFSTSQPVDCQSDPTKRHIPCFLAGDHRANEQLGLTSVHTLWMREHNRLATGLREINPQWSGDKIFFETRKIVGAMHQHIAFSGWLPVIMGRAGTRMLGRYAGYDPSADASVANVFATAAFRFGHTMISPVLHRLDAQYSEIAQRSLPLHQAFFAPHRIVTEGGIDPVIRGLTARGSKRVSPAQPLNSELTERLFRLAHEVALDLGALNIQRARDHGIPGYNAWRAFCGFHKAESFDDFRWSVKNADLREKMRVVYGHPENIDLFAGMVLEDPVEGAQVGPITLCLIVDQMKSLRAGDRFWYESADQFSAAQLAQIRRVSLARVICDNADNITELQRNAFLLPSDANPRVACDRIDSMSLSYWKDCRAEELQHSCSLERPRRHVDELQVLKQRVQQLSEQVAQLQRR